MKNQLELEENGNVKKRYARGTDLVFADKGNGNASGEGYERQYYVSDPHGNAVQLTDQNGKVTKTYEYDSFGNEVKPDGKDDNPFRYCGEYYQPEKGRFLTRDTYTGEEDEPESLHLYAYCGNDGVNQVDPSGHLNLVVSGGIYKYDKRNGYCYEFIETALRYLDNIVKFPSIYKKNIGKTKWLIADNGWSQKNKDAIRKELNRIGNIQMEYFKNRKDLIKKINVTPKTDPIKTFTVFSHGYPGKIMFGYDSHNDQKKFDFRVKDIKKLRHSAFKNTGSVFYSCRTASGTKKKNFAYQWQFFTGGRVVAYKGRTNYKYINSKYSGALYYYHRVLDKITGRKEEVRRYPQKSRNMPTGKEKVTYNPMVIRAK